MKTIWYLSSLTYGYMSLIKAKEVMNKDQQEIEKKKLKHILDSILFNITQTTFTKKKKKSIPILCPASIASISSNDEKKKRSSSSRNQTLTLYESKKNFFHFPKQLLLFNPFKFRFLFIIFSRSKCIFILKMTLRRTESKNFLLQRLLNASTCCWLLNS